MTLDPVAALTPALFRIWTADASGASVGAGFLVTKTFGCTCAHVVAQAVHGNKANRTFPTAAVWLDFPFQQSRRIKARVHEGGWHYVGERTDLCILEILEGELAELAARPVPLVSAAEPSGPLHVYGFINANGEGVWTTIRAGLVRHDGLTQCAVESIVGYPIAGGFSGTPVWSPALCAVVGMISMGEKSPNVKEGSYLSTGGIYEQVPSLIPRPSDAGPHRPPLRNRVEPGYQQSVTTAALTPTGGHVVWSDLGQLPGESPRHMLFPEWGSLALVPGRRHPDFDSFHPDIVEAQFTIRDVGAHVISHGDVQSLPLQVLDPPWQAQSMLLIGGPKSNDLAFKLRGHQVDRDGTILVPTRPTLNCRWDTIPLARGELTRIARYVAQRFTATEPKAVRDARLGHYLVSQRAPEYEGRRAAELAQEYGIQDPNSVEWLTWDYLLVSVLPNPWATERWIVDIGDLHGQGDKAFADLVWHDDVMRTLAAAVKPPFQALFRVPVHHEHGIRQTFHRRSGVEIVGVEQLPMR